MADPVFQKKNQGHRLTGSLSSTENVPENPENPENHHKLRDPQKNLDEGAVTAAALTTGNGSRARSQLLTARSQRIDP